MIKAAAKLDDGSYLVVLGLSDRNVIELRKDRPIVFDLVVLDIRPQLVVVTYKHPDGRAGFPRGFPESSGIGLVLGDDALESMLHRTHDMPAGDIKFVLFRGRDEAAMERQLCGLIDHRTKVTRQGQAPSDVPPSPN